MDPINTLNPRPRHGKALDVAPDPSLWQFVVRRRDRFADRVESVPVSYMRGVAITRDITTPWDGVRAATLFLRNVSELSAAKALGWREDITDKWRAHVAGELPSLEEEDAATVDHLLSTDEDVQEADAALGDEGDEDDHDDGEAGDEAETAPDGEAGHGLTAARLRDMTYRDLQAVAKDHDVSPKQSARAIVADLKKALGL